MTTATPGPAVRSALGSSARGGVAMAAGSMTLVQLGLAASVALVDRVGAEGAAGLRLGFAGLVLVLWVRPWRRRVRPSRSGLVGGLALGAVTACLTTLFMAAVARIPLGTASAIEFLGPLGVAVVRSRDARAVLWPVLAGAGVLALTQPWRGEVDTVGALLALGAAGCWAAYIVLTQRVGDELAGVSGLGVSLPFAGLLAVAATGPGLAARWGWDLVPIGLGLALLVPVLPFALEMLALRRLSLSAFGTLMALEPAIAATIGLVLLGQRLGVAQVVGVALVVAAGWGAERGAARPAVPPTAAARTPAAPATRAASSAAEPEVSGVAAPGRRGPASAPTGARPEPTAPADPDGVSGSSRTGPPPTSSSGSR